MIKENTVITAFFVDAQETQIRVCLERKDGSSFSTLINSGEQTQEYQDLLEQISLETIRKNTIEQQKIERESILRYARSVFDEEVAEIESSMISKLIDTTEENPDFTFKVKLAVFNLDEVKNASTEEKKAIRQATSSLETLYLACKLVYEK